MPTISDDYLTVLNVFATDSAEKQQQLLGAMRNVIDNAGYSGWISSTMHTGVDKFGTANFIQWRSGEDLEARYDTDEFKHRTLPLFWEITTSIKLLQTQVVYLHRHPDHGPATQIGPDRDDHTVIEIYGVAQADQPELIEALGAGREWLAGTPGYRAHTVLRGLRARGVDGAFVAVYSQWADHAAHQVLRAPTGDAGRDRNQARIAELATWSEWNSYRAVHTRSSAAAIAG